MTKTDVNRELFVSNGFAVGYERIPSINSFNIGVMFKVGSYHEPEELSGITHLIEHTLFKRTKNYSNRELVYRIEGLGGDFDAFTGHEGVTVTIRILKKYWKEAIELMFEILMNAVFDPEDLKSEKKVILEEIEMYKDTPHDHLFELFSDSFWKGSPLGRSVLGTKESLESISAPAVRDYYKKYFTPSNALISVAGDLPAEELKSELLKYSFPSEGEEVSDLMPAAETFGLSYTKNKRLRQSHMLIYFPGVTYSDDSRYAYYITNAILGATDFSLFNQEIREERGLAYNLYSDLILYPSTGVFLFYVGFNPGRFDELGEGLIKLFKALRTNGIDEELLTVAKNYVTAKHVFSLDVIYNIMEKNGAYIRRYGVFPDYDEIIANIEKVTLEDVREVISKYLFSGRFGITYYGSNDKKEVNDLWKKLKSGFSEMKAQKK